MAMVITHTVQVVFLKNITNQHVSVYIMRKCWLVAWLVGNHLLFRDFGPYGIIFMNVCCYNRGHGNAVKSFGALCLQLLFWLVCDHLLSRDFGPYRTIFMMYVLL
jgi:hypothetical protein